MIALMALDLPELERPANATSRAHICGKLLLTRRRKQEADIGKLAHGRLALESTHASVQFAAFQGARKTMIESRFSLSLAAAFVCVAAWRFAHDRRRRQDADRRARPKPAPPRRRCAPPATASTATAAIPNGRISLARTPPTCASSSRCSRRASASTQSCSRSSRSMTEQDFADRRRLLRRADARRAWKPILRTGRPAKRCTSPATPRATFRPARPATAPPARAIPAPVTRRCARSNRSYTVKQLQDYLTEEPLP